LCVVNVKKSYGLNTLANDISPAGLKMKNRPKSTKTRSVSVEPLLQKTVLIAFTVLGISFILVNVPITILLGYSVSELEISSQQIAAEISGTIMFILASIALMVVGLLLVIGAVQYYERGITRGVVFLSTLVASFYLLCLGVGSIVMTQETNFDALLMLIASILFVVSAALYMTPSFRLKISGDILGAMLGVLGGAILALAIYNVPILDIIFKWDLPFTGPFMSMVALEGIAVVLGPISALVYLLSSNHSEGKPLSHVFLSLTALIYGIGLFIGSFALSLSFWNWIWKSPWYGPFHGMPSWVLGTLVFWSSSLLLIAIGGIILVASSFLGFIYVVQELS